MKPYVITIERQYGSGGKTIGKMLAQKLGVPFYNRDIVTLASEESGINPVLFSDERLKPDLLTRLRDHRTNPDQRILAQPGGIQTGGNKAYLNDEVLFEHQARVIRELADQGPCVMVGRCADYVLQGRENVIRVFVHADDDFCFQQAMERNSMDAEDVRQKIKQVDEYHGKYYKFHTGRNWYDARNYDLSLNSGVLGFEGTMEAIIHYMEFRAELDEKK